MSLIEKVRSRKKHIIYFVVTFFVFYALFQILSTRITVAFTIKGQECFPYKFWVIHRKETSPQKGEYIAFRNPAIDGRATWIKVVTGIGGDTIEVYPVPIEERETNPGRYRVFVPDVNKEFVIQGFVFLKGQWPDSESQVFEVFEKDSKGRGLPIIEPGVIPYGKYFVSSPAVRSYDSRYWGLVDASQIIGKAYPIF